MLAALLFGLPAVNRALPAERSLPAGQELAIGYGVTITPPVGARVDVTRTLPNRGVLALVLHGLDFRAEAKTTSDGVDGLAGRLRTRVQNQRGVQVTGDAREVHTDAGVRGLRGTFSSTGRDGIYAAYVANGIGVQITVSGTALAEQVGAVEQSLAGLRFG
ncbi:hypothetical protein R8Z50_35410 [Longispora sp. K20-0274]|uniref:hypothetical protein n=1 Tax=Longispora sp. K20-0274 TaxID=3088255 RepID=UPI00399B4A29